VTEASTESDAQQGTAEESAAREATGDTPVERRRALLAPHLAQILCPEDAARREESLCFKLGVGTLELTNWESKALARSLRNGVVPQGWLALFPELITFQGKHLIETEQLDNADTLTPDAIKKLHDGLVSNAAVGLALTGERQLSIDMMIATGQASEAKQVAGLLNKLRRSIAQLEEQIGERSFRHAEKMSEAMITRPEGRIKSTDADGEHRQAPRAGSKAKLTSRRVVEATDQGHLRLLVGAFLASIVVWAIFILPGLLETPIPTLTSAELPSSPAILDAQARPPSLYVKVDQEKWDAMSGGERERLIDKVGFLARDLGYTGVLFSNAEGQTVAQFFQDRGQQLVERPKSAS